MPVTTETRLISTNYDGDGGFYTLAVVVDVDTAPNGSLRSETLRQVTIDNTSRSYETNYRVNMPGLTNIDSSVNPEQYPPVVPGDIRTFTGLNFRIDNRATNYALW
jgi:hypothetical protein